MEKKDVVKKVEELIVIPHCCSELKEAGRAWIDSIGSEEEKTTAEALIAEIEEDIVPIDELIEFAESEGAVEAFGEERAREFKAHAYDVKASGSKYCDCAACTKAKEVLDLKEIILG